MLGFDLIKIYHLIFNVKNKIFKLLFVTSTIDRRKLICLKLLFVIIIMLFILQLHTNWNLLMHSRSVRSIIACLVRNLNISQTITVFSFFYFFFWTKIEWGKQWRHTCIQYMVKEVRDLFADVMLSGHDCNCVTYQKLSYSRPMKSYYL